MFLTATVQLNIPRTVVVKVEYYVRVCFEIAMVGAYKAYIYLESFSYPTVTNLVPLQKNRAGPLPSKNTSSNNPSKTFCPTHCSSTVARIKFGGNTNPKSPVSLNSIVYEKSAPPISYT